MSLSSVYRAHHIRGNLLACMMWVVCCWLAQSIQVSMCEWSPCVYHMLHTTALAKHWHLFRCFGGQLLPAFTDEGSSSWLLKHLNECQFWLVCNKWSMENLPSHSGLYKNESSQVARRTLIVYESPIKNFFTLEYENTQYVTCNTTELMLATDTYVRVYVHMYVHTYIRTYSTCTQ